MISNEKYCDCRCRPVGMPHTERVTVHNLDSQGSLHLLSLSGSTSHFHCSFFLEKVCRQMFVDVTVRKSFSFLHVTCRISLVVLTCWVRTWKYCPYSSSCPDSYSVTYGWSFCTLYSISSLLWQKWSRRKNWIVCGECTSQIIPSVIRCCWFGVRKGIQSAENLMQLSQKICLGDPTYPGIT